jgi:hypothetical protein
MAINKKPPNSGSDATNNESDAKIDVDQPLNPFSNSNTDPDLDLKESLLIPVSPQTSSSVSRNAKKTQTPTVHQRRRPWWQMWQIWGILLVLCSGGIGYGATSMLLKLPKTQSCSKVFWPVASASIRLYCAQTAAEKKDVEGLLAAINLVAVLPDNHPLSSEINRNIDRWATSILTIGESEFQSGKLEQAIATARKIPKGVSAQKLVDEKIADWNSIWSEGEEIYQEVENKLREADWNGAFSTAVRLTESPNKYWATTKYEESIDNINVAQEENASLSKAQIQVTNGQIDELILAIDKADDIDKNSYAYNQAQKIITEAKTKLIANIEQMIETKDWQELLRVSNKIPSSLKLQKRVKDWQILANAGSSADLDTVFGIEEAIEEVKRLKKNSEYYPLGQNLIRRWKLEIEDVRHLTKAREFARVGTISNLNQAITEARLIPNSNPRYSDAQQEINGWQRQIQIIEDQPILDRARELSYGSNVNAWQRAIAEANLISSNSPLYGEAQDNVRTWRDNIERVQDQPILDEADSFANRTNYPAAINTARKIRSGRSLYSEAQSKIALWQAEIDGERYLREAEDLADEGTPEALARAIRVARQAPSRSSAHSQVVIDVNDWAAEILDIARDEADDSLESAIEIAGLVPSGTTSFSTAQEEIKIWKIQLYPDPEIVPPNFKLEKLKKELN